MDSSTINYCLIIVSIILGSLALLVLILFFVISLIFFNIAFKRKNVKEYTSIIYDASKEIYHWYEKENTKDVNINSFDNTKLTGVLVENNSNNHLYFITIHGYHGMFISRMPIAKEVYYKYNATVLAINLRGHYTSEGKYNSLGYYESKDLIYWINYIISLDKEARIVVDGVSMGATTIMYRLNELDEKHVVGAVCDCGFYGFYNEILKDYKKFNKFLYPFAKSFLRMFYRIRYKTSIKKLNCYKGLSESKIPTLLIHAKDDSVVSYKDHELEIEAFNKLTKLEILEFEDGGHARTFYNHNKEYKEKLFNFLNDIF